APGRRARFITRSYQGVQGMVEEQLESRETGIYILTVLGIFLYVIALWFVVSLDQWFYYWTSP
ncbi:MAG TPA: hypothetical protein VFA18_09240, partial [Gemmataceae bacterium]|nr:hypothetical protein [Gemmataceae bacterium]